MLALPIYRKQKLLAQFLEGAPKFSRLEVRSAEIYFCKLADFYFSMYWDIIKLPTIKISRKSRHFDLFCNTEAKRNFVTHHNLSVEITIGDLKTLIGDVIDTFTNTAPAANHLRSEKVKLRHIPVRVSYSKI